METELFTIAQNCLEQHGIRVVMTKFKLEEIEPGKLLEEFSEMTPTSVLFYKICLANQNICRKLLDFVRGRGVEVWKQRGLNINKGLTELYRTEEHVSFAPKMISGRNGVEKVVTQAQSERNVPGGPQNNRRREQAGHRTTSRYTEDSTKYSGNIDQSWKEYSNTYLRYT